MRYKWLDFQWTHAYSGDLRQTEYVTHDVCLWLHELEGWASWSKLASLTEHSTFLQPQNPSISRFYAVSSPGNATYFKLRLFFQIPSNTCVSIAWKHTILGSFPLDKKNGQLSVSSARFEKCNYCIVRSWAVERTFRKRKENTQNTLENLIK